ncbi:MAG: DNA polymerase III subunit beta [bacterium]|nr:DNA polymerase III subunit beta [bacterium]MDZ4247741.1 DNA polymerase III subunit beta [Patescibacteria group bacterium]
MKLVTTQDQFAKALGIVSRMVNPRGTLSVLANVLLETKDGRLRISATNLELGIDYSIGAKIEKEGSITVPARLLNDYVNNLGEEKLELSTKEQTLVIKSTGAQSTINGIAASEFPVIPEVKEGKSVTMSAGGIKDIIQKVAIAAASDETRPILSGVLFYFKDPELKVAATDSYRLAELSMRFEKSAPEELKVVVPAKALLELGRIVETEEVTVRTAENQVQFETDHVRLVSRLLEGEFPKYDQIIPEKLTTKAVVKRDELMGKIRIASLFSEDAGFGVKISFVAPGKVEVAAETAQVGDSHSSIPAKVSGPENTVAFNARYLLDGLNAVGGDTITLESDGKLNPCVVRGKAKDYLYVVMPLRV